MSKNTLYDKIWDAHKVRELPTGQTQLFIGRHLIHEVTSPQAFEMLKERGLKVKHPEQTFAVMDHIVPTDCLDRPFEDEQAELMAKTLEDNVRNAGITYFAPGSGNQGICHVVFPEQGLIWPGTVAVCGDSHTCTYGALGALAFGIGTTQVSHVLATQTLATDKLKVRKVKFNGRLQEMVTAKDLALYMIRELGVKGGVGFVYEFSGEAISRMGMEARMTLCNMAIEGGARAGYINPDIKTFAYLKGKPFAPEKDFKEAVKSWESLVSGEDAEYDDVVNLDAWKVEPMVTWGINPGQAIDVTGRIPKLEDVDEDQRAEMSDALEYMELEDGQALHGLPVDVVFIGSCTNGRLSDLRKAAQVLRGSQVSTRTIVVPGSEQVKAKAEKEGLDYVFRNSGAEWRNPGCSMCLAMNPDKLEGYERGVSTSSRNFKGRQGSPTGRTHLVSPFTAAATAIEGKITHPVEYRVGK